jgi:hypothetical protein
MAIKVLPARVLKDFSIKSLSPTRQVVVNKSGDSF